MPNPLTPKIAPIAIALTAGLALGYGVGRMTPNPSPDGSASGGRGGYAEGFEAAKKMALGTGFIQSLPEKLTSLEGTVSSVESGSLTMDVALKSLNPFEDQELPTRRRVRVTEKTEIIIQTRKSAAESAADEAAFQKSLARGEQPQQEPNFTEKAGRLADLKSGDRLIVTADTDIKTAAEFDAVRILIPLIENATTGGPQGAPTPAAQPSPPPVQP